MSKQIDAIRERHNKPVDLVDIYSYSLLVDDVGELLAKIDADAKEIAELNRKLKYTRESRDEHSKGWTNCVIELGEAREQLKKCREGR